MPSVQPTQGHRILEIEESFGIFRDIQIFEIESTKLTN
jgi:hypothetical protein